MTIEEFELLKNWFDELEILKSDNKNKEEKC